MRFWAWATAGVLVVLAGCSSSDSSSDETDALPTDTTALEELVGEPEPQDDVAADDTAPRDAPAPTTTTAPVAVPVSLDDLGEIVLQPEDLPDGWREDPLVYEVGVSRFGVEPLFFSACEFTISPPAEEPAAVVETAFEHDTDGARMGVAVVGFEDEAALSDAVGELQENAADCSSAFTDVFGGTQVSELPLVSGDAAIAAVSATPDPLQNDAFAMYAVNTHDVTAQVGPYLIVVRHFGGEVPDLGVTQAALDAMVQRAEALIG
ncbi:MAG: hypothetical protein AAGD18_25600 [Actinomycetota bacterium]